MDGIIRLVGRISTITGHVSAYLVLPLIVTIVYSVIVRYSLSGVIHWAFEVSIFLWGIMVMLGGAYTLQQKAHVRVDVLPHYLGPRGRCALDVFSFVVIILVCGLVIQIGTRAAWMSTLRLERSPLQTPFDPQIWWFRWFIPASALLVALQALVEIAQSLRTMRAELRDDA